MCCYNKPELLRQFKRDHKGQKVKKCWKVIRSCGASEYRGFRYAPGKHIAKCNPKTYSRRNARGIHIYLTFKEAECMRHGEERLIPVYVNVKDIFRVGAEYSHINPASWRSRRVQAVTSRIFIREKDWKDAGIKPFGIATV